MALKSRAVLPLLSTPFSLSLLFCLDAPGFPCFPRVQSFFSHAAHLAFNFFPAFPPTILKVWVSPLFFSPHQIPRVIGAPFKYDAARLISPLHGKDVSPF